MASKEAKKVQNTYTKAKETKGTWAFSEDGDPEKFNTGGIYIKRSKLEALGHPEKIKVTIEAV